MATHEFSAGGVVVRDGSAGLEVAVITPATRKRLLALPKGHLDGNETAEAAAIREVREETGLVASLETKIDDVRYVFRWQGQTIFKTVAFFLFRYVSGEIDQLTQEMRGEIERARWISLADAARVLSYRGERDVARKALAMLARQPTTVGRKD